MGDFFRMDGGILTFLGKIFDIFFLSLLWFVFCLPIFTIGASTTALYYTTVKVIRRDRGYIFKEFWKSFKLNFVSGSIFTLMIAALSLIFYYNISYASRLTGVIGMILLSVYIMIAFIMGSMAIYLFPLLSRFTMTRMQMLKSSLFMAIKHLPTTIAMALLLAVSVILVLVINIAIIIVPATACFILSYLMERVLKKYMPNEEDDTKDTWYLE